MDQIDKSILDTIEKYNLIKEKDSVLVAVSGGPDSTALFHLLMRLYPGNVKGAVYINHNLRPGETEAEIDHVKRIGRQAGVKVHIASVNVPHEKKVTGESTEECARRLRYKTLEEIRMNINADLTAVGHTGDDQVEEVLIRLVRGCGLKGLSGINPSYGRIIRPLINISKKQILAYLILNNLDYCVDSSNLSKDYLRNRIRLELLPILEEKFNPAIRKTIRRTAEILADEEAFISAEAERVFNKLVKRNVYPLDPRSSYLTYAAAEFITLDTALKRRLIEKMFHLSGAEPNFQAIQDILRLSDEGKNGAELHMNSGLTVYKSADEVFFSLEPQKKRRIREAKSFEDIVVINEPGIYRIDRLQKTLVLTKRNVSPSVFTSDRLFISLDKNIFPMVLRQPLHGESFTPLGAPGRKKISKFLSDRKIPRPLRYAFPVLVSGDDIIAIAGITISNAFRITDQTSECLEISWE